jgi:hypothetical protein
VELVNPLWNLCAFVVILCEILKYHLIGVVLTDNFNFGKYVLINLESSIGAFVLTALCLIYLIITITFHLFTAPTEYKP